MTSLCSGLKTKDNQAFSLCKARVSAGDTLVELDAGVSRLDFKDPDKPQRSLQDRGDGKVSPEEVYGRFLDTVLAEEGRRAQSYLKNLSKPPKFNSLLLKNFKDNANTRVPFVFDDLDATTDQDEKLFVACLKKIQKIKTTVGKEGLKEGSKAYRKRLAEELFHFIRDAKKDGGLGIDYDAATSRADRDLSGIAREGKASCLEFVFLFDALARLAGLPAVPVEVFRDQKGYLNEHVRIAVKLDDADPSQIIFVDISDDLIGERKKELWAEIPRLELLSYYYNGLNVESNVAADREKFLRQALRYAPTQYMTLNNLGHLLLENGTPEKALTFFLQGIDVNPQYPFLHKGLAKVYEAQGSKKKAEAERRTAEDLFKPKLSDKS